MTTFTPAFKKRERTFMSALRSAGWYAYRDKDGRAVTNAYRKERKKVEAICGMPCVALKGENDLIKIALKPTEKETVPDPIHSD